MSNKTGNEEPLERKPSNLRVFCKPVYTLVTERAGALEFFGVTLGGMKKLEELEAGKTPEPAEFLNHLMMVTGRHAPPGPGEEALPVSEADITLLSAKERASIASGLLEGLHFQSEPITTNETDADGARISKIDGYEVVTPRENGEDDEAYLQRAWRAYNNRLVARWKKTTDAISKQMSGFSAGLREAIGPGLLANFHDSKRLSEQLSRMASPTRSIAEQMKLVRPFGDQLRDLGLSSIKPPPSITDHITEPRETFEHTRFSMPDIPPNPIYETNSLLEGLGARIENMYEVSQSTAAMQQSLNEVARDAVAMFAAGAEDAQKASEQGLRLSIRALIVGITSAVLSALAIGVTVWSVLEQGAAAREERALVTVRHREDTALRERELAANEQLATEIRRSREGAAGLAEADEKRPPRGEMTKSVEPKRQRSAALTE